MSFFELTDTEKKIFNKPNLIVLAILLSVLAIYALSDWDHFYNRYLAKDEELDQGYFYSLTNNQCVHKVDVIDNESDVDKIYELSPDSLTVTRNDIRIGSYKLQGSRLFYITDKGTTTNGLQFNEGFQYLNDSTHRKIYGKVLEYFRNNFPPNDSILNCEVE